VTRMPEGFIIEDRLRDFLDRAGKGPRAALFLTYQLDQPEFSRRIWDPLLSQRYFSARNCAIMFDANYNFHRRLDSPATSGGPLFCRVKVRGDRCFHPKMVLVGVGGEWFIGVSSGNLGRGGLGENLELAQSFNSFEREIPLPLDIRDFVEELLSGALQIADSQRSNIKKIINTIVSMLPVSCGDARGPNLMHSFTKPLLKQMRDTIGGAPVRRIDIISPLHLRGEEGETDPDSDDCGSIIKKLSSSFNISPEHIHLYTEFGSRAPYRPIGVPDLKIYCREKKRMVNENDNEETDDFFERPLHAKAYLIWVPRGWHVFWGSANLTAGALDRIPGLGGNVELLVHEFVPGASKPLRLRGYAEICQFEPYIPEKISGGGGAVILAASFSRSPPELKLEWSARPKGVLFLLGENGWIRYSKCENNLLIIRSLPTLKALGFLREEIPLTLIYRIGNSYQRWVEVLSEIPVDELLSPGHTSLEDGILEILGVYRRQPTMPDLKGGYIDQFAHNTEDLDNEVEDEAGIGFTEHDGALLLFFRRWRVILRRLIELKCRVPRLYEVSIKDILEMINEDKGLNTGQLALMVDCLIRPNLLPVDLESHRILRSLCDRIKDSGNPLGKLAEEWQNRLRG